MLDIQVNEVMTGFERNTAKRYTDTSYGKFLQDKVPCALG
jgi:hypothetical protein